MPTSLIWKIATGAVALITIALMGLLLATYFENRDLMKQRDTLSMSINDPRTGYVAQLAQARTNVETLKAEVSRQNQAYSNLSASSEARLADATRRLAAAQRETRIIEQKLAVFLSTEPQGSTLEAQVLDIDNRILKELAK